MLFLLNILLIFKYSYKYCVFNSISDKNISSKQTIYLANDILFSLSF